MYGRSFSFFAEAVGKLLRMNRKVSETKIYQIRPFIYQ